MTLNPANARIFGSDLDAIYLAPLGTPLPNPAASGLLEALNGAFEDVGWLSDDGVAEELSGSKTKYRGHQGQGVIRTRMEESGTEYTFVAAETKAQTLSLRYDEAASSTAGGVRTSTRRPGQKVSARAAVLDFFDADDSTIKERLAIPRFEIAPDGNSSFIANGIRMFPFRGEIIGQSFHWANNPAPKTVWTVNVLGTPTGGFFTLLVNGFATAPIAHNAANTAIAAAINAISGVTGLSGVNVTGTAPGPFTVTFGTSAMLAATHALTGGTTPSVTVA
jgi:hypothetical protein